jgi:hypothetical protein
MITFPRWHTGAILVLAGGLLAGCMPQGYGVHYPTERVIVRSPAPAVSSRLYRQADRDARMYTRRVARSVVLTPVQQRAVHERLTVSSHRFLERTHPADRQYVYPFPRRAGERDRDVRRFWRDADRAIERTLAPAQRRVYRDYVRYHYPARVAAPVRRGRR